MQTANASRPQGSGATGDRGGAAWGYPPNPRSITSHCQAPLLAFCQTVENQLQPLQEAVREGRDTRPGLDVRLKGGRFGLPLMSVRS